MCHGNACSKLVIKLVVKLVVKHADSRAEAACVTAATLRGLRAGDTSKSSSSDSLLFFV